MSALDIEGLVERLQENERYASWSAGAASALLALKAENDGLREAFDPFLNIKDQMPQTIKLITKAMDGLTPLTVTVTKAQFLRARAILRGSGEAG